MSRLAAPPGGAESTTGNPFVAAGRSCPVAALLTVHHGQVTTSATHAEAFYREAIETGAVWAVRDAAGFPAPETPEGRAMPFWSLESRAQTVVRSVPAYAAFEVVRIPLREWRDRWLTGLRRDGVRVGLNWSGPRAKGYDLDPDDVERSLKVREDSQAPDA